MSLMGQVIAAAVYARISSHQDGTALGVKRQIEDCRKLADELGWVAADEYVDHDISAYSGRSDQCAKRCSKTSARVVGMRCTSLRQPVSSADRVGAVPQGDRSCRGSPRRFVAGGDLDVGNGDGLASHARPGRPTRRRLNDSEQASCI